jgi:hypothetical protein
MCCKLQFFYEYAKQYFGKVINKKAAVLKCNFYLTPNKQDKTRTIVYKIFYRNEIYPR